MSYARAPPELSSIGPMEENWKTWKDQFLIFLKASEQIEKPTNFKAYLLINLMGSVAPKVLEKLIFDAPNDRDDFDILLEKFDEHFLPKVTEAKTRFLFFSSVRQQSETIKQYVNTLKKKATACKFGELTESLIRDKIVLDVKNKTLRKHFLTEPDISLDQMIELWEKADQKEKENNLCLSKLRISDADQKRDINTSPTSDEKMCNQCGIQHEPKKCPARGQICDNCGMHNHFAKVCTKPAARKFVSDSDKVNNDVVGDSSKQDSKNLTKYFNPGPMAKAPGFHKK